MSLQYVDSDRDFGLQIDPGQNLSVMLLLDQDLNSVLSIVHCYQQEELSRDIFFVLPAGNVGPDLGENRLLLKIKYCFALFFLF